MQKRIDTIFWVRLLLDCYFITGKLAKEDVHKVGKYSLQRDRISQFWCCGHQKTVLECLHFDQKTRLGETNCHNRGMPEKIGGF